MVLPSCLASCKIASYSSPQNPNRTQSSSGSHCSATWLRSSLPFKKRSNVPSSLMTRSRAVFVVVVWFESFRVRLTRHLNKDYACTDTIETKVTAYGGSSGETGSVCMVRQDKGAAEGRTKESSQLARRYIGKCARRPGRKRVVGDCSSVITSWKEKSLVKGDEICRTMRTKWLIANTSNYQASTPVQKSGSRPLHQT